MHDVAVIGCGIVGAAVAMELSRYRLSVAVLEKENDVATGTTRANSAIIHAGYDPEPGTLMARLNLEGAALARELFQALDIPYRACGSMVLAFSSRELRELDRLYQRGLANGVPDMELLDGRLARRLEPALSGEVCGALLAPSAMIVSPWEYALALAETAVDNGASFHRDCEVLGLEPLEPGWRIHTSRGSMEAAFVVNAAGLYADRIHNMAAPPAFRITPDRGQYYLLDKSEGDTVSRIIFQCPTRAGKGTLVSPTVHGNLIVGPNNDLPRGPHDLSTTRTGLEEVAHRARKSVPHLNLSACIRSFAGNRAVADVEDFIIAVGAPGFVDLAGIKSPGLSAAPAIARMAVGLLEEEGLSLEENPSFTCSRRRVRFSQGSTEERMKLAASNPAYGRVVCRCETVTEGEILDALASPIPPVSVDGVKRRCGPGMGRCQGGFCTPRVVELLARHYGLSPLEIPQDRVGTTLLTEQTKCGRGGREHG